MSWTSLFVRACLVVANCCCWGVSISNLTETISTCMSKAVTCLRQLLRWPFHFLFLLEVLKRHFNFEENELQEYTDESRSFMDKIIEQSGVGEQTYMPEGNPWYQGK